MASNRDKSLLSKDPWNVYRRAYAVEHPEKQEQWRINSAVNLLTKHGFTVNPPKSAEGVHVNE